MYLNEINNNRELAHRFANDLIHKYITLLFIKEKKVLGTISWDIKGGIEDGVIELIGLGVNPEYRRQGIAKKLVNRLIEETKKLFSQKGYSLRVIFLYMERENEVGELFYKSQDFRKICKIPSFYPNNDAIIWIKYF